MVKKRIFDRFSNAGSRKKPEFRKSSSHDSPFESYHVIDADFVEVEESFLSDPSSYDKLNSGSIDPKTLEKLKEYLKTRSQEEISEIFEEICRILEDRTSGRGSQKASGNEIPINERGRIKEFSRNAFRTISRTVSCGKKRIIKVSKAASLKASSIASEGKESIVDSSQKLNEKWNNLSPRDRKIISELIIAMIEIGLLKNSTKGKKAAFAILSSISRRQTPVKKDLEEFLDGFQRFFKSRLRS
ncbi:MAG TPA: hypothetical protein VN278_07910 [Methanosarcina sp.]|nr:hypothetical protein [Methanosarcina sp.]